MFVQVNIVAISDTTVAYMRAHIPDAKQFKDTNFVYVQRTMPIPRINEHIVLEKNMVFRVRDIMYILQNPNPNNSVSEIRVLVEAE